MRGFAGLRAGGPDLSATPASPTGAFRRLTTSAVALVVVAVSLLFSATPAGAITNGQPDGNGHPYVGVLVDDFITPNFYEPFCTATVVAPRLMVSSAHCFWGYPLDQVWVSFDPAYTPGPMPPIHGTAVLHPDFPGLWGNGNGGRASDHDIAVVHLDTAVSVVPAHLPAADLLQRMNLREQTFDAVGYGMTRDSRTRGPNDLGDNFDPVARNVGSMGFHSLQEYWIVYSQNIARGESGWCYGDSGSAAFLANTDTMVSLASNSDNYCRAMGGGPRLDTQTARSFLGSQGTPLP